MIGMNGARTRTFLWSAMLAVSIFGTAVLAAVAGAIYTTLPDGSAVNANIYSDKSDVYLNGGPQNQAHTGLRPDGAYYFQVTDPSGAVLLSTDPIKCRVAIVAGGRVVGVPAGAVGEYGDPACYHRVGTQNPSQGGLPVQMMPYDNTPNPGGEYKVWFTPVEQYAACPSKLGSHGFCNDESKTDNFKVKSRNRAPDAGPEAAYVRACKFNDVNGDGAQGADEPFIAHWPITAVGVNGGTVTDQTGEDGCVSFAYSGFSETAPTQVVTLSEGTFGPDWTQTAPLDCGTIADCSVANGAITVTLSPGANVKAPSFGNHNPFCGAGCDGSGLVVTANTYPSLTRTFAWGVTKDVDLSLAKTSGAPAVFNYTVTVTHDAGTDSAWATAGTVRVSNPGGTAITALTLSNAVDNGGDCAIAGGSSISVAPGSHVTREYTCTFQSAPPAGAVNVTATWSEGTASATAPVDFALAAINVVDGEAAVNDTRAGALGVVSATDPSPKSFTYSEAFSGTPGTCTAYDNVADLTLRSTQAKPSASQAVKVCVGANLSVATTATTAFASAIEKTVDRAIIQQFRGTPTFNYTVRVRESAWTVSGVIQILNPNDWQDVSVSLADVNSTGGSCAIQGGDVALVPAGGSVERTYTCTYVDAPTGAAGLNTASSAWDGAAAYTSASTAQGTAGYSFAALTVDDTFNGGTPVTLGTVVAPAALTEFAYPRTVANAGDATCRTYGNTARIVETAASASQSVVACNTATGASTIGFWHNKNGQGIIANSGSAAGVCNVGAWLRQFTPYQDLSATASCSSVASYALKLIKSASASGASMNAMLKAQMLATALDVFFSDAALGGNALNAAKPIGQIQFDLTQVCSAISSQACVGVGDSSAAFGGATRLTALNMLAFQNNVANSGGSLWYGNQKTMQELAKNAFDAINNQAARLAQ